jgi:hypothetical protein
MSAPSTITILTFVSNEERAAAAKAAELVAQALSDASNQAWSATCDEVASAEDVGQGRGPTVLVTSLTADLDSLDQPWPEVEARVRARYGAWLQTPGLTVFICTLFRHVARTSATDEVEKRRARIRRLNALALELSRELGVMIADVDRDLAAIGARAYDTDHRLQGPYAAAAAGKSIALALLHVGLDDFAPFPLQETAREQVRAYQPPQAIEGAPAPLNFRANVVAVRLRQRVQVAEYADGPADTAAVASHVKRLLSGQIGLGKAAMILTRSVAKHGLKPAFARLLKGLRMAVGDARPSRSSPSRGAGFGLTNQRGGGQTVASRHRLEP